MSELRDEPPPVQERIETVSRAGGYGGSPEGERDAALIPGPRQARSADAPAYSAEGETGAAARSEAVAPGRTENASDAELRPDSTSGYAQAGGTGQQLDHGRERLDISQQYPSDYVRSDDSPPNVDGPHESPETWAGGINPDKDAPGRDSNCGECAR